MPPSMVHDENRSDSTCGKIDSSRTQNSQVNFERNSRQDIQRFTGNPSQDAKNGQFTRGNNINLYRVIPPQRNAQIPANYDRNTSKSPYMNAGMSHMRDSGHVAVRGRINCLPGAKKYDLIEAATLRSLLFPNDGNMESNMGFLRSWYFDDSDPISRTHQQVTPQFVPDTMESNIFHLDYPSDDCIETSYMKADVHMGGLEQVDADVFGYEPAGQIV
ncbi:hypothetical protein EPUL_003333 [Erysiphe pulchra]|uniref:Uncharacterized protein n=1 Tax=Erysiphe pulchra TaxID=225359 RepID=A0A2S4PMS0_9PEZI|nr:hypothetical protein EPUL_003333 [Erysiphe pulchra]